jgi:hypothetical protein
MFLRIDRLTRNMIENVPIYAKLGANTIRLKPSSLSRTRLCKMYPTGNDVRCIMLNAVKLVKFLIFIFTLTVEFCLFTMFCS